MTTADRRRSAVRLTLLVLAVATLGGGPAGAVELRPPERDAATARDAARRVLDRPEYRRPPPTVLQRARSWAIRQLERLLGAVLGGGRGQVVFWAVAATGLVVTVVVLVRFGRGMTADPARRLPVPASRRRTAAEWRAEAEAHEGAGRWRAGLRCRYRALLADLAERGVVDDVPGRTAGEYRQEVRQRAAGVAEPFGRATELFELAWYGNRPTGAEEAATFQDLAGRVLTGAAR